MRCDYLFFGIRTAPTKIASSTMRHSESGGGDGTVVGGVT